MNCAADLMGFISSDALIVSIAVLVTAWLWWRHAGKAAKTSPPTAQTPDRDVFGERNEYPYQESLYRDLDRKFALTADVRPMCSSVDTHTGYGFGCELRDGHDGPHKALMGCPDETQWDSAAVPPMRNGKLADVCCVENATHMCLLPAGHQGPHGFEDTER